MAEGTHGSPLLSNGWSVAIRLSIQSPGEYPTMKIIPIEIIPHIVDTETYERLRRDRTEAVERFGQTMRRLEDEITQTRDGTARQAVVDHLSAFREMITAEHR